MVTKQNLRIKAKEIRKNLDVEKISAKILDKILALKTYQTAKNIMLFCPKKFEIDLMGLLEDKTKNFFLPRVEGDNLVACSYKLGDELVLSKFKTLEPVSASNRHSELYCSHTELNPNRLKLRHSHPELNSNSFDFPHCNPEFVSGSPQFLNFDIIIVPALMADKQNYRLGYGGGFYDKFLKTQTKALKITPIPSELIVDALPIEEFDQKIDLVISEL